jgi:hypothetical protein
MSQASVDLERASIFLCSLTSAAQNAFRRRVRDVLCVQPAAKQWLVHIYAVILDATPSTLFFLKIATATLFVTTVRRRVTSLDDPSIGKFQANFILVDLPLPL